MSDISEFAVWEELHQPEVPSPNDKEQRKLDMADPERVWAGEDSSNDLSGGDSDAELPSAQKSIGREEDKEMEDVVCFISFCF